MAINRRISGYSMLIVLVLAMAGLGFSWKKKLLPGVSSEVLLSKYRKQAVIGDSSGSRYKLVYKSKHPDGYGSFVYIYKSTDGGGSWKKLSTIGLPPDYLTYTLSESDLAIDCRDRLYFVCARGKVIFSKSADSGKTWSPVATVAEKKGVARPVVFTDKKGTAYITYDNKLTASADGGGTWRKPFDISAGVEHSFSEAEGGRVYLGYVGGKRKNVIYVSYSDDKGANWHTETTGELGMMIRGPYVIGMNNALYVVCQGWMPNILEAMPGAKTTYRTYYLKSSDGGRRWSGMKELKE